MISSAKSWLFLPAHRLDRFETAKASCPSVVCLDLQDGLPAIAKDPGRQAVKKLLGREVDLPVAVRINSLTSEHGPHDVRALKSCANLPTAVILPMIENAGQIEAAVVELGEILPTASLIVMIETASAICDIDSICGACPRNAGLLFGNADMSSAIRCANDWESLAYVRSRLVVFAAKWGLPAFDGVTIDLESEDLLERECLSGRKLGFCGKAAVHPKQVKTINRVFSPTAEEVAEARSIVAAYEASSGGAIRVGNKMVDRPVYLAAVGLLKTH
jgi:(S)-citramalyl-CoA lyase